MRRQLARTECDGVHPPFAQMRLAAYQRPAQHTRILHAHLELTEGAAAASLDWPQWWRRAHPWHALQHKNPTSSGMLILILSISLNHRNQQTRANRHHHGLASSISSPTRRPRSRQPQDDLLRLRPNSTAPA